MMLFGQFRKINTKLRLYFFSLILLAVAIAVIAALYVVRIKSYHELRSQIDRLLVLNPKLIKAEQNFLTYGVRNEDFMRSGESEYLDEHNRYTIEIKNLLVSLRTNQLAEPLHVRGRLSEIQDIHERQNKIFAELVDKIRQRGYKGYGLEGKMRQAIHQLQTADSLHQITLLTLRRYEKDFFLRKEGAYIDSLKRTAQSLLDITRRQISLAPPDAPIRRLDIGKVVQVVNQYVQRFDRIAQLEREIGLTENTGLKGKLNATSLEIEQELVKVDKLIDQNTALLDRNATWLITIFFFVIIGLALLFATVIAYRFSKPIETLDRVAQSVTRGLRNQEVILDKIKSNDEIGSLARNFKTMLLKFKENIQQITLKNEQLEALSAAERQRAWFNEGIAIFNEILRHNYADMHYLADEIIGELVKYTNSQQGGFYLRKYESDQSEYMQLMGCYAYEQRRVRESIVRFNEGLLGSVWRTGERVHLTDLPPNYASISSALGKATPTNLLIMPLKSDEGVEGLIELLSFRAYTPQELEILEMVANRIGNAIVALQANARTRELLALSEAQAREAQEQEARLYAQIEQYQHWIREFEQKVNTLAEETHVYNTVLGKIYAGFIQTDEFFRIKKINTYAARRLGFKRQELETRPVELFIDADFAQIIDLRSREARLHEHMEEIHVGKVRDKDGQTYPVEMTLGRLDMDGKPMYIFLFNEISSSMRTPLQGGWEMKVAG